MGARVVLLLAGVLGSSWARAAPTQHLAPGVAARFLRAYGFGHAIEQAHVRLRTGGKVALSDLRSPEALWRVTRGLEQRPSGGLLGLGAQHPAVAMLAKGFARPVKQQPLDGSRMRALLHAGRALEAHDLALALLLHGEAPLGSRVAAVADVYLELNQLGPAQLLVRKLARIPGAELHAQLVELKLARARKRPERALALARRIVAEHPDDADVIATCAFEVHKTGRDPGLALSMAWQAHALAPDAPDVAFTLGRSALYASFYDRYVDAAGKRRPRRQGLDAALAQMRRATALGAPLDWVAWSVMTAPGRGSIPKLRPVLKRAVEALRAGALDDAEAQVRGALAIDRGEAIAYIILQRIAAARRATAVAALGGDPRRRTSPVKDEAHSDRLVALAASLRMERIAPGYRKLSLAHQALLAHALLPWSRWWHVLEKAKSAIHVVELYESITDHAPLGLGTYAKTFDGRSWYGVRGAGGTQAAVAIEELETASTDADDTAAHELTHIVHAQLPKALRRRVTALYKAALAEGRIVDPYSRSNEDEYLARGVEAWISLHSGIPGEPLSKTPPLLEKDPQLCAFIAELLTGP